MSCSRRPPRIAIKGSSTEVVTHKIFNKFKAEFIVILPPTLFCFIALHRVALIRVGMAEGTGIRVSTSVLMAIAALILDEEPPPA